MEVRYNIIISVKVLFRIFLNERIHGSKHNLSLFFLSTAASVLIAELEANSDQVLLSNVHCNGTERGLLQCEHSPLYSHCTSSQMAGVSCYNGRWQCIVSIPNLQEAGSFY